MVARGRWWFVLWGVASVLILLVETPPVWSNGQTCTTRPPVRVNTQRVMVQQQVAMQATVGVSDSPSVTDNRLHALRFGATNNALIDIDNQLGRLGSFDVSFNGTRAVIFTIRPRVRGQALLVPFVAVDNCGDWPTFIGGGVSSLTPESLFPAVTINNPALPEGNSGQTNAVFAVSLSASSSQPVMVNFATQDGTATAASNDYVPTSGMLTFNPGQTQQTVTVAVLPDTMNEAEETVRVNLGNPTNAVLGNPATGTATISNDDPEPGLFIQSPGTSSEPTTQANITVATVSLNPPSGQVVSVNFATKDGTATVAGNDYVPTSGMLTFNPGQTQQSITVGVLPDTLNEADETIKVVLSNPVNATLPQNPSVSAVIVNDDPEPKLAVTSSTGGPVDEGSTGTTNVVFVVGLTPPSGQTATVNFTTQDGTATVAGNDYVPTTGILTFNPGQTQQNVTIQVVGDTQNEPTETFSVALSNPVNAFIGDLSTATAVILNDDALLPIVALAGNVTQTEGDPPTLTTRQFSATLSNPSAQPVTVTYTFTDVTATHFVDYSGDNVSGTVTFDPGQVVKPIPVIVDGDNDVEGNETATVTLSNPVNATLGTQITATLTIVDDD